MTTTPNSVQNRTTNSVSHAGHSMARSPGRRFIRRLRWHPGQAISTRGVCGANVKKQSQLPHLSWAGRVSTPATKTLEHEGQESFSSFHFRRVSGCSTLTCVSHNWQVISPRPVGNIPLHFGQESGGAATLDSTTNSSDMAITFSSNKGPIVQE